MSVKDETLIEATTEADSSKKFKTVGTHTIMCDALLVDEFVIIQQTHDGSTFQNVILNGITQAIDIKHTLITLIGPGVFRVVKSVTASPVKVVRWITEES